MIALLCPELFWSRSSAPVLLFGAQTSITGHYVSAGANTTGAEVCEPSLLGRTTWSSLGRCCRVRTCMWGLTCYRGVLLRNWWWTRVRGRACRRGGLRELRVLSIFILVCKVSHLRISQRHRDAIDAYFYARSKALGLEVVLRSKFPGAVGDYRRVNVNLPLTGCSTMGDNVLSSWRLSTRACFWPKVMPVLCLLRGPSWYTEGLPALVTIICSVMFTFSA